MGSTERAVSLGTFNKVWQEQYLYVQKKMSRKFQRRIQTVGGRLSPWKDDTNESRLIAAPVVQDAKNITEPIDDGSVQNKYWQKRRKSAQYDEGRKELIPGELQPKVQFPRRQKTKFPILY